MSKGEWSFGVEVTSMPDMPEAASPRGLSRHAGVGSPAALEGYRGTSLIENSAPLGPYSRSSTVVIEGGGCFLCARYPCTRATGAGVAKRVGVGTPGGVGFILSDFGSDGCGVRVLGFGFGVYGVGIEV